MPYIQDLDTIHNPSTGAKIPAAWGDAVNENFRNLSPLDETAGTSESFTNLALWEITHTLPFQPAVTAVDAAGSRIFPDVDYVSSTVIHITHAAPMSGTVYLS